MPFLLFDHLFLKSKYAFSPGIDSGLPALMYIEQERHPVVEILNLFFFSPNHAKNVIEIGLLIDYFPYYLYLSNCFSKIVFHVMEVFPSRRIDWRLPK